MSSKKPCVFIQTNPKQLVGALVAAHCLRRQAARPDQFDVSIMNTVDYPFLHACVGREYLRDGERAAWADDLQSFTPLRFLPPELMGYDGRALVIDPDVFAVADVSELLFRDMQGKAILCRPRTGSKGGRGCMASSVMLLDCAKLRHWRCEAQFAELFEFQRDYMDWICLRTEPQDSIGRFEDAWNDFDTLSPATKMLHNTKRQTQPWKTGLPVDFRFPAKRMRLSRPKSWLRALRQRKIGHYLPHPDPNQERFFFDRLRECLENGVITGEFLREEIRRKHVREDSFEILERLPRPFTPAPRY